MKINNTEVHVEERDIGKYFQGMAIDEPPAIPIVQPFQWQGCHLQFKCSALTVLVVRNGVPAVFIGLDPIISLLHNLDPSCCAHDQMTIELNGYYRTT